MNYSEHPNDNPSPVIDAPNFDFDRSVDEYSMNEAADPNEHQHQEHL